MHGTSSCLCYRQKKPRLLRIVSGGQTGVDRGALDAVLDWQAATADVDVGNDAAASHDAADGDDATTNPIADSIASTTSTVGTGIAENANVCCCDDSNRKCIVECGGWCPKGRIAEDGTIPLKYPLQEISAVSEATSTTLTTASTTTVTTSNKDDEDDQDNDHAEDENESALYAARTLQNVRDSDGTVILYFGHELVGGTKLTLEYCQQQRKPYLLIDIGNIMTKEMSLSTDQVAERIHNFVVENLVNLNSTTTTTTATNEDDNNKRNRNSATVDDASNGSTTQRRVPSVVVLNVAGPRASTNPEAYEYAYDVMTKFLTLHDSLQFVHDGRPSSY